MHLSSSAIITLLQNLLLRKFLLVVILLIPNLKRPTIRINILMYLKLIKSPYFFSTFKMSDINRAIKVLHLTPDAS